MFNEFERKSDRAFKSWQFRVSLWLLVLMLAGALLSFSNEFFFGQAALTQKGFIAGQIAALPFGAAGFVGGVCLFWAVLRRMGADRVVVWLRRFHQQEPSRFPLPKMMMVVGASNFQVVTIQDSRFKWSYATGLTSSMGCLIGLLLVLFVPLAVLAIVIGRFIVKWLPGILNLGQVGLGILILLSMLAAMAVLYYPLAGLIVWRRGSVKLRRAADVARVDQWMMRVQSGIGHIFPGLKIYQCGDEFWMDAVELMLRRCDAAIIDVSDLNENMRWELGQCAERVSPYKLVLAYGVPPEYFPADPPDWLYDEIAAMVGHQAAQNVIWMPYPEPLPVTNGKPVMSEDLKLEAWSYLSAAVDTALGRLAYDDENNAEKDPPNHYLVQNDN